MKKTSKHSTDFFQKTFFSKIGVAKFRVRLICGCLRYSVSSGQSQWRHQWKNPPVTPHFRIDALQVGQVARSAIHFDFKPAHALCIQRSPGL